MKEDMNTFPDLNIEKMPFVIESYGTVHDNEENQMLQSVSSTNVMGYVSEGTGIIETASGIFEVTAGDSYLLRAGDFCKSYKKNEESWTRIWVSFSGNIVVPILDAYGLTHSTKIEGISIYEHVKQIHNIVAASMDADLTMNQCCDVFVKMCQYIRQQLLVEKKEPVASRDVAVLKSYMDTHLSEHFTLEKCSEIASLSVSQTIRKFRSSYGMPPYEYLNQRRIETAKQLLVETEYSIQEISEVIGFQDPYYFSKYFKKKCGKSPNSYRESLKGNQ